nr:hypothetical protein [Motilimonas cestriensis]
MYGWGANHCGQLGSGPGEDIAKPIVIPHLPPVCKVYTAAMQAYAIDEQGKVWSWGWDAYSGLLGRGDVKGQASWLPASLRQKGSTGNELPQGDGGVATPAMIENLNDIAMLACCSESTIALSNNGSVWAWGEQQSVGSPSVNRRFPTKIEGLEGIVEVFASNGGSCFYALDELGKVWSWGGGYEGELGHGKRRNQPKPEIIPGIEHPKQLAPGNYCCWFLDQQNQLYFWGNGQSVDIQHKGTLRIKEPLKIDRFEQPTRLYVNEHYHFIRLANGNLITPVGDLVEELFDWQLDTTNPMRLTPIEQFEEINMGADHGLALDRDGKLFAFGDASQGALGNGITEEQRFYLPTAVPLNGRVIQVRAGQNCSFAIINQ